MSLGPRRVVGSPLPRPKRSSGVQSYALEVARGVGITSRHFFTNTKEMVLGQRNDPVLESVEEGINTISYPEQRRPYPARFRGVHRLTRRDDGTLRCVACMCCSTACPAQCIHIEAAEFPEGDVRHGYEKYPKKFVIDELRCIFCGYCVEACPCDAIRMDTGIHAAPYDSRDQFIFDRKRLKGFPGRDATFTTANPRLEAGDPGYPVIDRKKGH